MPSLVVSEMCIRDRYPTTSAITDFSGNYTARAHTFSIGVGFSF